MNAIYFKLMLTLLSKDSLLLSNILKLNTEEAEYFLSYSLFPCEIIVF